MADPVFFLGLGGQKCGSSWVQAYLDRAPGSDFGRLGEYQVWEHALGGVFARYAVPRPPLAERLRARAKITIGADEPAQHLRWRLQSDPNAYFDYFQGLLNQPGIARTGDVTPSYAALPADRLAQIRDEFARRGIETRAIFVMRDPVARLHSLMRMEVDKGRLAPGRDAEDALRAFYVSDEAEARSRYDLTLAAMETAFPPEARYVCLFEELFTDAGIESLSRFAGVPVEPAAGARKVNARAGGAPVSDALSAEIAAHYEAVYRAAAERLPQIRTLWPSAKFVLTTP
ncbi:hypothetical protein [Roseivivax sp. THAF30]|uniref:hypothetical protein n=1 Tax=Roseivivax sp. THAF30 TaxID=2587852 RepID=UPI001268DE08|nr:hypothetical protein [Roseivivax sp. THAF30]QFT63439.1 hypothetical protein FIU91_10930 [Roseivivax sp. THAF30]